MRTISQALLTFFLNACWQIALIAGVASLCGWLLRGTMTRYRHAIWVAALVLSFLLPALTCSSFLQGVRFSGEPVQQIKTGQIINPILMPGDETLSNTSLSTTNSTHGIPISGSLAAALLALYVLFLGYRALKLFRAWRRTIAITRSAQPAAPSEHVLAAMRKSQAALGVGKVGLLCSSSVPVPITVGSTTPFIILPEPLLREVDAELLASAVGHELAHVLRHDYLLNLIYELFFLPISFHPAAALLKRRVNQTRELCCDELVAERLLDAHVYARSLVQLAGAAPPLRRLAATITVGIADADILEVRIMTLLRKPKLSMRRKKLLLIAASLLLAIPCVAAASFAFRFDIDPQATSFVPQLGQSQEAQEKQEKEARAKREREERAVQEREGQELKERIERETDPEVRAKLEEKLQRMQKEQAEREDKVVTFQGFTYGLRLRREQEENEKKAMQAELVRQAKISMDQAIQIAVAQQPGKVLECSLVGEHWEAPGKLAKDGQVLYHVVILSGDDANPTATHVLVNAIDGQIVKAEKEKRRKEESGKEGPRTERR